MRVPIAVKLAMAILLPLGGLVTFFIIEEFYRRERDARAEAEQLMAEQTRSLAARLDAELQRVGSSAAAIAAMIETVRTPDEAELWKIVRRSVSRDSVTFGCCIAFEPGTYPGKPDLFAPYAHREIAKSGDTTPPSPSTIRSFDIGESYDYTDPKWEWYARARAKDAPIWTEPYFDEGGGNTNMVTYAVPFSRPAGEEGAGVEGVVTADVRLQDLQGLTDALSFPQAAKEEREIFVITPKGRIISSELPGMLSEMTAQDFVRLSGREDIHEMSRRMGAGESGSMRMRGLKRDEAVVIAFAPMPGTGCSLGTSIPERIVLEEAYSELKRALVRSLTQLAVVMALLVGAVWWIMRPVRKLVVAVGIVGRGDLNATVPARTQDEIGDLGRAFNDMTAKLREHIAALTRETKARESVESELRIAQQIQQSLLPQTFPPFPDHPEFNLHAVNVPARTVGGDFYDFFFVGERLIFVIADVSGKGVPAALLMAVSRTVLRNVAMQEGDPGTILTEVNRVLAVDNQQGMFVTVFIGSYNPMTGDLIYANGAHIPPVIRGPDRSVRVLRESTGTVVGAIEGVQYTSSRAALNIGDALVMVTDGVTEARPDANAGKDLYGEQRLLDLLKAVPAVTSKELCDAIVKDVDEHAHGTRADDTTVMVLRRVQA